MGMKAQVTGTGDGPPRELPPPGNYLAVCNGVYMLGTQPGYQGQEPRLQVMLSFQLHKRKGPARDSHDRVFETSAIMNLTANVKSTLIAYAGAMRGRDYDEEELKLLAKQGGFDPESLLACGCRLVVEHKKKIDGTTREAISVVSRLDPEDDACPAIEGDETYWDWTTGVDAPKRIKYFWDRAQENPDRLMPAGTYSAANGGGPSAVAPAAAAVDDDSVPF